MSSPFPILSDLETKIKHHTATVGVVGLGYVGLPLAVEKAKAGFRVIGIEQNQRRMDWVNRAHNYISDVQDKALTEVVQSGKLRAVNDFQFVPELDVIVICVPTPLTPNLTPNLSCVESVTRKLAQHLRPGQLITLESTTYPGTTDEIMRPLLEISTGLQQGVDFFLAYSPERVDPGNRQYTTRNTSKVVGASDPSSLAVARLFYEQTIAQVIAVNSARTAELVKVFENTFRAVNIALVNELALLCDRMDLNVWEVLDAAYTKPFGIMPFYPGPGVGGHCIAIDPHYLEWKAKEFNFETRFISLAGEINRQMPEFVRRKAWRILNRKGIAPSQARILIIGVGYKKDQADWRESPAVNVIAALLEDQATLTYHDPYIPEIQVRGVVLTSVELVEETITEADLVIIATDHSKIDYRSLVQTANAILDTRGVTRHLEGDRQHVTLL
uniref:Nucleotide sugar dehydrogenase n=1 Tax=Cyanothece sp. (strain PCC 7425 / ATCC 29141) TaxID=395961 RepID=B8HUI5_CYAP4